MKLKTTKCQFCQVSIEYLCHRLTASGISTTTAKKVEAEKQAPVNKDLKQLRSFLGLVQYLGKFIPNLSAFLHPLNELLKKEQP